MIANINFAVMDTFSTVVTNY